MNRSGDCGTASTGIIEPSNGSRHGIAEFAGLEVTGLENDGLENDGVQEETYILHTIK